MTGNVLACIDSSKFAAGVCDAAVWSSKRLNAPLKFLHVLRKESPSGRYNLSGSIGLGAREALLAEMASLDEQRGKLAQEGGRQLLDGAKSRALTSGGQESESLLRIGGLVETLTEFEGSIRLVVIGRRGEAAAFSTEHLGSHLERVIRAIHRPILVTVGDFVAPKQVMLAYDGSPTARKGLEMLAASPMFKGLPCHVVMVGADTAVTKAELSQATGLLENVGFTVPSAILSGDVEVALGDYQKANNIDMMIMGAYGHSRIRHLFVGSTTTTMLRESTIPLLLLR